MYGQQNQTSNMTGNQTSGVMSNQTNQNCFNQNETGIGTAQEIELLTPPRGGLGQKQEGGQLGIIGELEQQTASSETVGGPQAAGNTTGEALQGAANETRELLGNVSDDSKDFLR